MRTVLSNEAGPPTTDQVVSPVFLAQSLQPNVYAACIVVTAAATIAVALRLLCRRLAKAYLWWDDWIIIAALVSLKCQSKIRRTALTENVDRSVGSVRLNYIPGCRLEFWEARPSTGTVATHSLCSGESMTTLLQQTVR